MLALPWRLKLYVAGVVVAAVLILVPLIPELELGDPRGLLLFLALLAVAELFPVATPRGGTAVTGALAIAFASVLLFGPGVGAVYGALGAFLTNAVRRRVGFVRVVFNMGQLALSLGIAGLVFQALGGLPLLHAQNSLYHPGLSDILPVLGCHFAYFFLNTGLVSAAVALAEGSSLSTCWRANYMWVLPQSLGVPAVAFLMALLYLRVGAVPVVVLFAWLMVFTRSFRTTMELRDSQRRTLAVLASITDAGLPHMRGRSAGVARLGSQIAREMGLSARRRELIEYAGLLHNLGFLGIDRRLLLKPGVLTAQEWDQVRGHVEGGASILEEVPTLSKVAGIVRAHHERPDGQGYPCGLHGDDIPLEAGIIRVAEAYEAMTSESPYQDRLRPVDALERLRGGAGFAFDRTAVSALCRLAERGELSPGGAFGGGN